MGAGCASSHDAARLVPERSVPARAALLAVLDATPAVERTVVVRPAGFPEVRVALERRGPAQGERALVLVHGVLSDRRAWRYVVGEIERKTGGKAPVVLVDLPGCGDSEAPDPRAVGDAFYDPSTLADAVLLALEAAPDLLPERELTLVAHSLGGTVVLRALEERGRPGPHAALLARVDSAVLFAPFPDGVAGKDESLDRVKGLSDLETGLGAFAGVLRESASKTVVDSTMEFPAVREEADRLVEILSCAPKRRAAQAMLRRAVPASCDGHVDWDEVERRGAALSRVSTPTLVVWGMRDETLPSALGWRLAHDLPNAWLRTVPKGTHPLHVEAPRPCAFLILQFGNSRGDRMERYGTESDTLLPIR